MDKQEEMEKEKAMETTLPKHGGGPVTSAGKEISKMNAMKFGLYSTQLLIKTEFYSEDEESLRLREEELRAQFCPEGAVEQMYMQRILFHQQGFNRTNAYEVGCLRAQLDQWAIDCRNELTVLQREIGQKESDLKDRLERLKVLTSNPKLDQNQVTDLETEYLMERAERQISCRDLLVKIRPEDFEKLYCFVVDRLKWNHEAIRAMLITHIKQVILKIEGEMSDQRSVLQAKTESLGERLSGGDQQLLLVDPEKYARIERSRSSHAKGMERSLEMLMKLQAFRIQKKRYDGALPQADTASS